MRLSNFVAIGSLFPYLSSQSGFPGSLQLTKPYFPDYGKERIQEYLKLCLATKTIPEVVWAFWFNADLSGMSPNRAQAFATMEEILQMPVILISDQNINDFLRWPVHDAVWLLSGNHKSDYFRVYFTLHYGGYVRMALFLVKLILVATQI